MRRFLVLIGETDVRDLARRALLRLGKWLTRLGRLAQAAALSDVAIVPIRKAAAEPIKVEGQVELPTQIKPRDSWWRMPTPEAIDRVRGECMAHALPYMKICRGPGKGCHANRPQTQCGDCFLVHWHDRRPSSQIIEAMERGDA